MKTKHTPGPWEIEPFHNGIHIWAKGKKLCSIWSKLFHGPEIKANAKLIVAAPKLLEALLMLMDVYESKGQLLSFNVDIARQAIKKATP